MPYDEEYLKMIFENELKPEDTFKFTCKMCGSCCSHRSEPILVSGMDLFRIGQALQMEMVDVLETYTYGYIGQDSHAPVLVLKEQTDGSCGLLNNGKCMVHNNKPVVCAIYPLGRYTSVDNSTIHYFNQENACSLGKQQGKEWTLKEWLDHFRIAELDIMSSAWFRMLSGVVQVTCRMDREQIDPTMCLILLNYMYLSYDINKRYEDEVEINIEKLKKLFKEYYNIDLRFD